LLSAKLLQKTPRRAGSLVVENWHSSHDRRGRQARLIGKHSQPSYDILSPLIKPELAALKDNRMVLLGYEIHVDPDTGSKSKSSHGSEPWPTNVAHHLMKSVRPSVTCPSGWNRFFP
jgi:hypothetical protein